MVDVLFVNGEDSQVIADEWRDAVANWSTAVAFSDHRSKRRGFQILCRLYHTKRYIYCGFERRGLLLRGFHKFKSRLDDRRGSRLRNTLLKIWSFRCWKNYLVAQDEELMSYPSIIYKGSQVYAAFKWLSSAFVDEHPIYSSSIMCNEAVIMPMIRRFRGYSLGHIDLPPVHIALHIHAIALLDAFQLHRFFAAWRSQYIAVIQVRRRNHIKRLRYAIHRWFFFISRCKKLQTLFTLVAYRHKRWQQLQYQTAWKMSFLVFHHIRCHYIPRMIKEAIRKLAMHANERVEHRLLLRNTRNIYLRRITYRWLDRMFHIRLGKLFAVSFFQSCDARSSLVQDFDKDLISKLYKFSNQNDRNHRISLHRRFWHNVVAGKHPLSSKVRKFFQKWRKFHRCPNIPRNRYDQEDIELASIHNYIELSTSTSKDVIWACEKHYKERLLRVFISRWLLSVPQLHQDCASYRQKLLQRNHINTIKKFVYMKRWVCRVKRSDYYHQLYTMTHTRNSFQRLASVFGGWFILFLRQNRIARASNQVVCKIFNNLKWHTFFAWKRGYERSVLIRMQDFELLKQRNLELQQLLEANQKQSKREIIRLWSNIVRRRRCGRLFVDAMTHAIKILLLRHALQQWCRIHDVETIVICLQRRYRGFVTRYFSHRKERRYLKWYAVEIKKSLHFYRSSSLSKSLKSLKRHTSEARKSWLQEISFYQQKRIFKRIFQSTVINHQRNAITNYNASRSWCLHRWIKAMAVFHFKFIFTPKRVEFAVNFVRRRRLLVGLRRLQIWRLQKCHLDEKMTRWRQVADGIFVRPYYNLFRINLQKLREKRLVNQARRRKYLRTAVYQWYMISSMKAIRKRLINSYHLKRFFRPALRKWKYFEYDISRRQDEGHQAASRYRRRKLLRRFFRSITKKFCRKDHQQSMIFDAAHNYRRRLFKEAFVILSNNMFRRVKLRHRSHNHIGLHFTRLGIRNYENNFNDNNVPNRMVYWRGNKLEKHQSKKQMLAYSISKMNGNYSSSDGRCTTQPFYTKKRKSPREILSLKFMIESWITFARQQGKRMRRLERLMIQKYRLKLNLGFQQFCRFIFRRKRRRLLHRGRQMIRRRKLLSNVVRIWRYVAYLGVLRSLPTSALLVKRLRLMYRRSFHVLKLLAVRSRCSPSRGGRSLRIMHRYKARQALSTWLNLSKRKRCTRGITKQVGKYYFGKSKRRYLSYLWKISVARGALKKITRRFHLTPKLLQWLRLTKEAVFVQHNLQRMNYRISRRVVGNLFHAWRRYTKYSTTINRCFQKIHLESKQALKHNTLLKWRYTWKQSKIQSRFDEVLLLSKGFLRNRTFQSWKRAIIVSELQTIRTMRLIFTTWFTYSQLKQTNKVAVKTATRYLRHKYFRKGLGNIYAAYFNAKFCEHTIQIGRKYFCRRILKSVLAHWKHKAHLRCKDRTRREFILTSYHDWKIDRYSAVLKFSRQEQASQSKLRQTQLFRRSSASPKKINMEYLKGSLKSDENYFDRSARLKSSWGIEGGQLNAHELATTKTKTWIAKSSLSIKNQFLIVLKVFQKLRRVAIAGNDYKRRRTSANLFHKWKHFSRCIKHSRLAFLNRLQPLLAAHRLSYAFQNLRFFCRNNSLVRQLNFYIEMTTKSKLFITWRRLFLDMRALKRAANKMFTCMTVFTLRNCWRSWRVNVGPSRAIGRVELLKHGFHRWQHSFKAVYQYRRRLLSLYFISWAAVLKQMHMTRKNLLKTREVVTAILRRMQRGTMKLVSMYFNTWKVHVSDVTSSLLLESRPGRSGVHVSLAQLSITGKELTLHDLETHSSITRASDPLTEEPMHLDPWHKEIRAIRNISSASKFKLDRERLSILKSKCMDQE